MPLLMHAVVDLNMLMPLVAGDVIPISKVLYHCVVSVKHSRGLVKSDTHRLVLLKGTVPHS